MGTSFRTGAEIVATRRRMEARRRRITPILVCGLERAVFSSWVWRWLLGRVERSNYCRFEETELLL
jgi:hypothetical protein